MIWLYDHPLVVVAIVVVMCVWALTLALCAAASWADDEQERWRDGR